MLISVAVLLLSGLLLGRACRAVRFPALFGMLLAGILTGPCFLDLLSGDLLAVSGDLRRIALIIILIRAGLKLDLADLKKVGRPAFLMCFVPASLEVLGTCLLAPRFFSLSLLDAAILGSVLAAVSPAVVVPRMIALIDEKRGTKKGIPQMILAGASVDDVYVIVLFTTFTGLAGGQAVSLQRFAAIPLSILLGAAGGFAAGYLLYRFFSRFEISGTVRVILVFALSLILNWLEEALSPVPFAGLIAIMAMGTLIRKKDPAMARSLSGVFDSLWVPAELFLFVLVGASVAVGEALKAGPAALLLLLLILVFRMAGVFVSVLGTPLTPKERLFAMLAYTPKATVQAAIGGLPLAMGLACGPLVLTVSVISILVTAPLGAFAIDLGKEKLLTREE